MPEPRVPRILGQNPPSTTAIPRLPVFELNHDESSARRALLSPDSGAIVRQLYLRVRRLMRYHRGALPQFTTGYRRRCRRSWDEALDLSAAADDGCRSQALSAGQCYPTQRINSAYGRRSSTRAVLRHSRHPAAGLAALGGACGRRRRHMRPHAASPTRTTRTPDVVGLRVSLGVRHSPRAALKRREGGAKLVVIDQDAPCARLATATWQFVQAPPVARWLVATFCSSAMGRPPGSLGQHADGRVSLTQPPSPGRKS